jgi:hypothetical protein
MRTLRAFALMIVVVLSAMGSAQAFIYNGTVTFTCTDFTAGGTGSSVLNRDNTGSGQEAARIDVRDGIGNLLYTLTFANALATYSGGLILTTPYISAPAANPLSLTVTSLAGNGLAQEVDYQALGQCAGLPFHNAIPASNDVALIAMMVLLACFAFVMLGRRRVRR